MGRSSTQITLEDRCARAHVHATGHALRQSAAALDRAPSTVARDLTRNASPPQGSHPGDADQQARARRWQGAKLARDRPRRAPVLARLQHGWSPQQMAGRLAREHHQPVISPETISRFIDAPLARQKDDAWRHSLPQAKTTRGRRGAKGRSPASCITLRPHWPSGRPPSRSAAPPATGRPPCWCAGSTATPA